MVKETSIIAEIDKLSAQARKVATNRNNPPELIEATIDALVARICQLKDEEAWTEKI